MTGPHSGKFAVINGETTNRNWTINELQEEKAYVASNTKGGTGRVVGVRDWNGSFGSYGHTPIKLPGELFNFEGYTAPDDDAEGSNGTRYIGPAIVDSVVITWDWLNQNIISYVTNFSGNGRLTNDTGLYSDNTDPVVPIPCETKVTYDVAAVDTDWDNLTQAVLTLKTANQVVMNSSNVEDIGGGVFECWRTRKKGIFDWTLALTEQETNRVATIKPGVNMWLKVWVDDTDYWELKWGHLQNFSNIVADRETGAIMSRQVNFGMNGFNPAVGVVNAPGVVQYWPFS